jgi:hypothetical protein
MMKSGLLASVLLAVLCLAAVALGRELSFQEHAAVQESLRRVHPRMRASWLRERGLDDSYYTTFRRPGSTGLVCRGRWPWGPSWELAGRDTFLYLGSGSGVRILSITDSVQPRMLGQINARGLVSQVVVQDSLLFVACGSWGAQIYSVANPAEPRELGSMDAVIGDLCVQDTFCYTAGGGSLRIYNCSDPTRPTQVGAASDGGDVIVGANGYVYVGHGSSGSGLNVYDVHDPANPMLVNTLGGVQLAMFTRGHWLFRISEQPAYFSMMDISEPDSPSEVGRITGYGGVAMYADDKYAYLSGLYEHSGLFVVDISDSSHPQLRDSINPVGVAEWDPYVPHYPGYGYLADDYGGLRTIDLHDADAIFEAWSGYRAHQALDVSVDGNRAYVADEAGGLHILDISNPALPQTLGKYDTAGLPDVRSAVARDSFAFITWWGNNRRFMRVLDVTDPALPVFAAEESCKNPPEDYVLRDSLLYAAEANQFQIFNVARPREPVRVGSCVAGDATSASLCVMDTLAFVGNFVGDVVDIRNPASPQVVGHFGRGGSISVRDTFAFMASGGILVYSVARPNQPRLLDSLSVGPNTYWVEAVGTLLYTGNRDGIRVVDAADIHNMRVRDFCSAPYTVDRLTYQSPYIYAACWEAGVSIYESTQVALSETTKGGVPTGLSVRPNPATTNAVLSVFGKSPATVTVRDIAGRVVRCATTRRASGEVVLSVATIPPGVYFVESKTGVTSVRVKFVRQ